MQFQYLARALKVILAVICATQLSACYFKSSLSKVVDDTSTPTEADPSITTNAKIEFVATAKPYVTTPSGFRARQSAASLTTKQKQSTPQGYIVYQYVQGQISSDELQ